MSCDLFPGLPGWVIGVIIVVLVVAYFVAMWRWWEP